MYIKLSDIIIRNLEKEMNIYKTFNKVYIFGSFLNNTNPSNDIDILIIYKDYSNEFRNDLNTFKQNLSKLINLPLDVNALSEKEESEFNFITRLNNNYLELK